MLCLNISCSMFLSGLLFKVAGWVKNACGVLC